MCVCQVANHESDYVSSRKVKVNFVAGSAGKILGDILLALIKLVVHCSLVAADSSFVNKVSIFKVFSSPALTRT